MRALSYILSFILIAGFSLTTTADVEAQQSYTFDKDNSKIHMYGSSNARDWDAAIEITDVSITLSDENPGENWIESLSFNMPVSEIDSDSRRLNNNIHDYLKIDDYPNLSFELIQITDISEDGSGYQITADGNLTVAGVERTVTLTADAIVNGDGSIQIKGSYDTLMTEFDIDPPTAMLGSIRAEDEVEIVFDVTLVPAS